MSTETKGRDRVDLPASTTLTIVGTREREGRRACNEYDFGPRR
jgi:hypothetical protein